MSKSQNPETAFRPVPGSLLEPTLEMAPPANPLYSIQSNFLVAFFGGVYAAAVFCGLNSRRSGRILRDVWILIIMAAAWSAILTWIGYASVTGSPPAWLGIAGTPGGTVRTLGRLVALLLFAVMYLRWRVIFKAQEIAGIDPPNPWPAGLGACVIAIAASLLFVGLGAALAS